MLINSPNVIEGYRILILINFFINEKGIEINHNWSKWDSIRTCDKKLQSEMAKWKFYLINGKYKITLNWILIGKNLNFVGKGKAIELVEAFLRIGHQS